MSSVFCVDGKRLCHLRGGKKMRMGGGVLGAKARGCPRRSFVITTSAISIEARRSIWLESLVAEAESKKGVRGVRV